MYDIDLTPLKSVLQKYIPLGRSGLLPALHAAQKIYGWLPEEVATVVAHMLSIPLADVHGVIEFYAMFYNKPTGRRVIRVCTDPACALHDGDKLLKHLCKVYNVDPHEYNSEFDLTIETSPCLGLCDQVPAVLTTEGDQALVDLGGGEAFRPLSPVNGTLRLLTVNCGGETTSLEKYGGYGALQKAKSMKPEDIVNEIKASGLVGRGGAAFPTGIKWEGALKAEGDQKFVICNADESEPGTFKDRILLLDDPHRTIEGMCIAAYAIGATKGYIYVRGEYPYIVPVLENALNEAKQAGYLENLDIEVRVGAGAYICGEETALFESIEGNRGFPRVKPPFPTTNGLFDKPTVINNVETLCNVPLIIEKGAEEYRKIGTEKSPGPKLFCVSGDVVKPGLYEVPFGVTLRELLVMSGGVVGGKKIKGILFGGAAGAFATSEHLDVKMTFEDLRAAGLPLGSGVVMVFDETRDMRDVLKRLGKFFAHESCGKCYPCQMGTQRQSEILDRIADRKSLPDDFARLQDVGWTMTDASLCGLGQTAASAVLSAMKTWPELFKDGSGWIKQENSKPGNNLLFTERRKGDRRKSDGGQRLEGDRRAPSVDASKKEEKKEAQKVPETTIEAVSKAVKKNALKASKTSAVVKKASSTNAKKVSKITKTSKVKPKTAKKVVKTKIIKKTTAKTKKKK